MPIRVPTPEVQRRYDATIRQGRLIRLGLCAIIGFNGLAWFAWGTGFTGTIAQAVAILSLYANVKSERTFIERHQLLMAADTTRRLYVINRVPYLAHLFCNMLGIDPYELYRRALDRWDRPEPTPDAERPPPPAPMPRKK